MVTVRHGRGNWAYAVYRPRPRTHAARRGPNHQERSARLRARGAYIGRNVSRRGNRRPIPQAVQFPNNEQVADNTPRVPAWYQNNGPYDGNNPEAVAELNRQYWERVEQEGPQVGSGTNQDPIHVPNQQEHIRRILEHAREHRNELIQRQRVLNQRISTDPNR